MKPADQIFFADAETAVPRRQVDLRPAWAALAVFAAYFLGAKVGLALTFEPHPVSVLWPPNAVLLSALLLTPPRWWGWILAGAFPAHLVVELHSGVPGAMVLLWFASNTTEALIGAVLVRRFMTHPIALDSVRNVLVFFCGAALAAPFLSSFLDAAFVELAGWGQSAYWQVWSTRFISNMLAALIIVPVAITWSALRGRGSLIPPGRRLEATILVIALLGTCIAIFDVVIDAHVPSALLYLPLPLLLWASLRFGTRGTSLAFAIFAFTAIWGATHGRGPFVVDVASETAFAVQIFLISAALPLLVLAAVIEESKAARRTLRDSEERFATAFKASPDAMILSRLSNGQIIDVNDRWQSLFGFSRADVVGRAVGELDIHAGTASSLIGSAARQNTARDEPVEFRTHSGGLLYTTCSTEKVPIGGDPCSITTIRDVTAQRRTERELAEQRKQLTHLSRVARLSELSGSLAHELNQPLTAILSNAQAAQRFLAREPLDLCEIRNILQDIVAADKRAGDVIRGLRVLMKKGTDRYAPMDLNSIVPDVLVFARGELTSKGVEVRTELATRLPLVNGDVIQLQQLLLNLLSNAGEAMDENQPGKRELTIRTDVGAHGTAQIFVSDTGPGLAADQRERLFEPFYTTKEHGLGLGLSICRTIMEAHGGSIHVENNTHRGVTFRAVFPASTGAAAMNAPDRTVFLVDDDASVRTALTRLLQSEGYNVKAYGSASAFLAQEDSRQSGCIVSDLSMPGLSGLELQHALAGSTPPRPIVFISGEGTIHSSVEAMRNGAVDFLTKPISDTDLLRAIEHAIEKDRRSRAEFEALREIDRRHDALTPREREVLAHVVGGRLNKQIAADLGTVEKTIKVHRARVMEKMGVSSVAELARLCERGGITPAAQPARSEAR